MAGLVTIVPAGTEYIVSLEDRREGREHVLETAHGVELSSTVVDSFKEGRLPQPTKALCDCCCKVHSDRDLDGDLFELCLVCQAELTGMTFEQAS